MYNAFSLKNYPSKALIVIKQQFRCICSLPGYGCSANSVVILVDGISHLAFFLFACDLRLSVVLMTDILCCPL